LVSASDRSAVAFSLTGGNVHDAKEGCNLLKKIVRLQEQKFMLMDKAYEGNGIREQVRQMGFTCVVPPKSNRIKQWEYDKEIYKRRNEIERLFLRLKRFRKVFTRYDKLDVVFSGFIFLAMCIDALVSVNTMKKRLSQNKNATTLKTVEILFSPIP
jgi:transposase